MRSLRKVNRMRSLRAFRWTNGRQNGQTAISGEMPPRPFPLKGWPYDGIRPGNRLLGATGGGWRKCRLGGGDGMGGVAQNLK